MPKFIISCIESHVVDYAVEAENPDEAVDAFYRGKGMKVDDRHIQEMDDGIMIRDEDGNDLVSHASL